jgi:hypothetical protein
MAKHTPGPWEWLGEPGKSVLNAAKNKILDHEYYEGMWLGAYNDEIDQANARLIAAAPDLLESLKAILACDGSRGIYDATKHIKEIQLAEIAIKKAEGGA